MTQEEIKSRNTALAAYMGWEIMDLYGDGREYAMKIPPLEAKIVKMLKFHEDMNLLMPVVWKLMEEARAKVVLMNSRLEQGRPVCAIFGYGIRVVAEPPALALWEAVSSLVIELQNKQ
jgi:hypothetical protein